MPIEEPQQPATRPVNIGPNDPTGGFIVIYEFQFDTNDLGFTYNSYEPGEVILCSGDASGTLIGSRLQQSFGAAQDGVSFGRFQTSRGVHFVATSQRTFGMDTPATLAEFRTGTGQTNAYPRIGPVIINELMYHPPDVLVGGALQDNTDDEYIELFNVTNAPTPLYDALYPTNEWRLRNGVSFDFPPSLTMPARSYLLVVGFNPTNTALLDAFRAKYNVPTNVMVLGPYSGELDNRGEAIEPPRLESAARTADGEFTFQFIALAGVAYAVDCLTNLAGASPVTLTNFAATTDTRTVHVSDPVAQTNGSGCFYRVRLPSQP